MTRAVIEGIVFGLSAGLAPGPLMALVLRQSLQYGPREGAKVACAPLLTDLPIIAVVVLLLVRLQDSTQLLGLLALAGALYLGWLSLESWRVGPLGVLLAGESPHSFRKGILVNLLNPHAYMFWLVVGGPLMVESHARHPFAPLLFGLVFYALLVGSKLVLALLAGRSRRWLDARGYVRVMRGLALLLALFALLFLVDGGHRLGWW